MASSDASHAIVPHPVTADAAAAAAAQPAVAKRRGSYNCGRCGLPKKGHVCSIPGPPSTGAARESKPRRTLYFDEAALLTVAPLAVAGPSPTSPRPPEKKARVEVVDVDGPAPEGGALRHMWVAVGPGKRVPGEVVMVVLGRLAPRGVAAAAAVCYVRARYLSIDLRFDA